MWDPLNPLPLVTRTGIHPTATLLRDPKSVDPDDSFSLIHPAFAAKINATNATGDHVIDDSSVPLFDQLALGSCVLNSTTAAMEILLALEKLQWTALSRNFLYWLCSKSMGTVGQDTGTYVNLAVERIGSIGICEENVWAYTDDPNTFFIPPAGMGLEAVVEASDNRPTGWFKIDESSATVKLQQLEVSIRADHPVAFGTPVSSAIQSYQKGQVLSVPDPNNIIGGHSMLFTGVIYVAGKRQWIVRNSWSAGWGDNGHCVIDDAWAADPDLSDLWMMTRIASLNF